MAIKYNLDACEEKFAEDFTSLNWSYKDHRDAEIATFSVKGVKATVIDYDGDSTSWKIERGNTVLARGDVSVTNSTHFFVGLAEAEAALRTFVPENLLPARLATVAA